MKKFLFRTFMTIGLGLSLFSIATQTTTAQFGSDAYNLIPWIKYVPQTEKNSPSSALLDTVRSTINWILWILATIALVICLYAWFKMLTSGWDSKWYDAWMKILKNAALWLIIIWLSWIIVSAIFWFVNLQADGGSMLWN